MMIAAILGIVGYTGLQVVAYNYLMPVLEKQQKEAKGLGRGLLNFFFGPALTFNKVFTGVKTANNERLKKKEVANQQELAKKMIRERENLKTRALERLKEFKERYDNLNEEALKELEQNMISLIEKEENLGKSEIEIFGGNLDDWLSSNYIKLARNHEPEPVIEEPVVEPVQPVVTPRTVTVSPLRAGPHVQQSVSSTETVNTTPITEREKPLITKIEDYFKLYNMVINGDELAKLPVREKEELIKFYGIYRKYADLYIQRCDNIEEKFADDPKMKKELLEEARKIYEFSLIDLMYSAKDGKIVIKWLEEKLDNLKTALEVKHKNSKDLIDNGITEEFVIDRKKELCEQNIDDPIVKKIMENPEKYIEVLEMRERIMKLSEKKRDKTISDEELKELGELNYNLSLASWRLKEIESKPFIKPYLNIIKNINNIELSEENKRILDEVHELKTKLFFAPEEEKEEIRTQIIEKLKSSSVHTTVPELARHYLALKRSLDVVTMKLPFDSEIKADAWQKELEKLDEWHDMLGQHEAVENSLKGLEIIGKNDGPNAHLMPLNEILRHLAHFREEYKEEITERYNSITNYKNLDNRVMTTEPENVKPAFTSEKTIVKVNKYVIDEGKLKEMLETITPGQQKILDCLNQIYKDGIAPEDVFDRRSLKALISKGIISSSEAGEREFDVVVYNSCATYSKNIYITKETDRTVAVLSKGLNGKEIPVEKIVKKDISPDLLAKMDGDLKLLLEGKIDKNQKIDIDFVTLSR